MARFSFSSHETKNYEKSPRVIKKAEVGGSVRRRHRSRPWETTNSNSDDTSGEEKMEVEEEENSVSGLGSWTMRTITNNKKKVQAEQHQMDISAVQLAFGSIAISPEKVARRKEEGEQKQQLSSKSIQSFHQEEEHFLEKPKFGTKKDFVLLCFYFCLVVLSLGLCNYCYSACPFVRQKTEKFVNVSSAWLLQAMEMKEDFFSLMKEFLLSIIGQV